MPRRRKKRRRVWLPAALIVTAVLAALIVRFGIVVRTVQVVGNRLIPKETIVEMSGVKPGDAYLLLSPGTLRTRLQSNRYIEYLGRGFDYKGTLTLRIRERAGMGTVNVLGLYYVLDESGIILECSGADRPQDFGGPAIKGLRVNESYRMTVGEPIPLRDSFQLEQMRRVLNGLYEVNMLGRITELNVEQPDNLYAMTREGARIILGDDSNLEIKLLIAREVLSIRKEMGGLYGARIDVSSGRDAHYIPDVLPTVTPSPTSTPTLEPSATPKR